MISFFVPGTVNGLANENQKSIIRDSGMGRMTSLLLFSLRKYSAMKKHRRCNVVRAQVSNHYCWNS